MQGGRDRLLEQLPFPIREMRLANITWQGRLTRGGVTRQAAARELLTQLALPIRELQTWSVRDICVPTPGRLALRATAYPRACHHSSRTLRAHPSSCITLRQTASCTSRPLLTPHHSIAQTCTDRCAPMVSSRGCCPSLCGHAWHMQSHKGLLTRWSKTHKARPTQWNRGPRSTGAKDGRTVRRTPAHSGQELRTASRPRSRQLPLTRNTQQLTRRG